jgi:hypothetical protein
LGIERTPDAAFFATRAITKVIFALPPLRATVFL